MMFYVFCKEGVEAAIVEVGIGGEYDNTNFIK
jgi:folylpolyglutamate synthase/dihydropteroate synthase